MHQHLIVTDLGFGDSGKGTIVDFLARKARARTIVRHNGGAQAAHNVVTPEGVHHTFSQFGSAMFVPDTRTYLSRFMLIEPFALFREAHALEAKGVRDVFKRLMIESEAKIITPYHRAANRLRELMRGKNCHGSCGMGIGEVMADATTDKCVLRVSDFGMIGSLYGKLQAIREEKSKLIALANLLPKSPMVEQEVAAFTDESLFDEFIGVCVRLRHSARVVDSNEFQEVLDYGPVIFEGAQGVLLDEWYGFHPYTTWSTTTSENAGTMLREAGQKNKVHRVGVIRAYMTRHGVGPMPTEDVDLTKHVKELHNVTNPWQHHFRFGYLDMNLLRYAIKVNNMRGSLGIDYLAMTCMDQWAKLPIHKFCTHYEGIDDIPVYRGDLPADLAHQEMLTGMLNRAVPVYKTFKKQPSSELLDVIKEHVGRAVELTSQGPTADDKHFLSLGMANIISAS